MTLISSGFARRLHELRFGALSLALLTSSLLTACDQSKVNNTVEALTTADPVLAEIGKACVIANMYGVMTPIGGGNTLSKLMESAAQHATGTATVKWEKADNSYIWRMTVHDALRNTDTENAVKFTIHAKPSSAFMHESTACGPVAVQIMDGISDGQTVGVWQIAELIGSYKTELPSAITSPASPPQLDLAPHTEPAPNASIEPEIQGEDISAIPAKFHGTWAPRAQGCDVEDQQISFGAHSMGEFEAEGTVDRVVMTEPSTKYVIKADFDTEQNGKWTEFIELTILAGAFTTTDLSSGKRGAVVQWMRCSS